MAMATTQPPIPSSSLSVVHAQTRVCVHAVIPLSCPPFLQASEQTKQLLTTKPYFRSYYCSHRAPAHKPELFDCARFRNQPL